MAKLYVCGRCGYRAHHRIKCPSCGFHLEEECAKCYNAQGNCICRFHGAFSKGTKTARKKSKPAKAEKKKPKIKRKK